MSVVTRVSLIGWSVLIAAPCMAQPIGTFLPTGNLTAPRSFHTATRLHDGKVLIAGCSDTASAEVYDPASHTFTPTGSMTAVRCNHSATLLADGRVLIAGGDQSGRHSAEVYDPSSGAFTPTGDMIGLQVAHTATVLPNGRVLIAGGFTTQPPCWGCPAQIDNPELYDPSTGTFNLTGAFVNTGNVYVTGGPAVSAAVALSDGRVLIAGEPTSELYDPRTGTFQLTGAMTNPCPFFQPGYIAGRTATLLTNGLVLLTGGEHEDCGYFAGAELYDVVTGTFTAIGSMTRPRSQHSATLLPDGTVLIAGGQSLDCNGQACSFFGIVASAEVFDPSTGTFTQTAEMSARRALHSATALDDGTVLLAGGYSFVWGEVPCCVVTASAELYVRANVGGQPASPDGTTVPTATQIIDNLGAVWTIGADTSIRRNGVQVGGAWGSQIYWKNTTIYAYGFDNNWWQWTGSTWTNVGPTTPGGTPGSGGSGTTSADGTMVPTTATQIVDNNGTVWTIGVDTSIRRNGVQVGSAWGSRIYWKNTTIYVYGLDGNWWQFVAPWTGSSWTNIGPTQP